MLRCVLYSGAVAVVFLSGTAPALSAIAAGQGVGALVGTYTCVTHDSSGKIWHFTSVNTMWGAWVRADTTFAPQNGQPADVAQTFVGFDSGAKRWNIVSIDTDGSYYTRYSLSRSFKDSKWIDGYPADGGKAIIGLPDLRHYTFDLTTPERNGRAAVSRTVCTRKAGA